MRNRTLKVKANHAENGNILSQFELFQLYGNEKKDEYNPTLARKYLSMCHDAIKHNSFAIKSLHLTDFRKFGDLQVDLSEKLTVFIGDNSTGKTSILEAIAKPLSWLIGNILNDDRPARSLTDHDISIHTQHGYAEAHLSLSFGLQTFEASLVKTKLGAEQLKETEIKVIRKLGDTYRVCNAKEETNLPLLIFYSVKRTTTSKQLSYDETKVNKTTSRFDAYIEALSGKTGTENFIDWFLPLTNLAESEEKSRRLFQLKEEITTLESLLESTADADKRSTLTRLIEQKHDSLKSHKDSVPLGDQFTSQLAILTKAISGFLPGFSNIYVDRSSGRASVYVTVNDSDLHINQLSDGQQMILGLVGDLTRRLIMLNPVLESIEGEDPLNGRGIVLIDEIELHLHPKWQQTFLVNLQATFKNIQFIVTTHSPQALSTIDKKHIRILNERDEVVTPSFQTKGVISSDILMQIMGTFAVPQDIDETHQVDSLLGLIQEGKFETSKAQATFKSLQKHFGEDHPKIKMIESEVKLEKLKEKIRQRKNG